MNKKIRTALPEQEPIEVNPLRFIRSRIKPTQQEVDNRHWRDKPRQGLLQRELASRLGCSEYCIQQCERTVRFPSDLMYRVPAQRLYELIKERPCDDGGYSLEEGEKLLARVAKETALKAA